MSKAAFACSRAKAHLMQKAPFFASMAIFMGFEERPDLNPPTMATDGESIFYHPDFVLKHSKEQLAGVIAHEVMHKVLKHHLRRGDRDPKKWNIATDYAINQILIDDGFELPEGGLFDKKWRGMTAEAIYSRLPDNPGGGQKWGLVLDGGEGLTEEQLKDLETEINGQIRQSATIAKMQGKLPGHMADWVEAAAEARVDWKERIWTILSSGRPSDFTWSRPNRTILAALDIYLPGIITSGAGTIVVVTDTSGSVTTEEEAAYLSEINAINEQTKPERTILLQCDTQIQHVEEKTNGEPVVGIKIHGRGGTAFEPPFEWVKQQGINPQCLVYLTDGYGPFPDAAPDYPVHWVITTPVKAPWGETIPIRI